MLFYSNCVFLPGSSSGSCFFSKLVWTHLFFNTHCFTVYFFFFGDYWKCQTRPDCVLCVNQDWKKELDVCQEPLWSVSLQTGKQWCFPDFFFDIILHYKPLYISDNEIVDVCLFFDKEKGILLKSIWLLFGLHLAWWTLWLFCPQNLQYCRSTFTPPFIIFSSFLVL